jgi:hypothetical protein
MPERSTVVEDWMMPELVTQAYKEQLERARQRNRLLRALRGAKQSLLLQILLMVFA